MPKSIKTEKHACGYPWCAWQSLASLVLVTLPPLSTLHISKKDQTPSLGFPRPGLYTLPFPGMILCSFLPTLLDLLGSEQTPSVGGDWQLLAIESVTWAWPPPSPPLGMAYLSVEGRLHLLLQAYFSCYACGPGCILLPAIGSSQAPPTFLVLSLPKGPESIGLS